MVDLGCGPGNLTALLRRAVAATPTVVGLDSSPEMIARPRAAGDRRRLRGRRPARLGDAGATPVDVLVSNATLQWVPGHLDLLPALVAPGARPAAGSPSRCPGNFDEPSHTIRARARRRGAVRRPHRAASPSRAATTRRSTSTRCAGLGCEVDAWETTYLHVLTGQDPVFTWVSGTGARPTLQALPDDLRPGFEEEFKRRLREAYPERDGTRRAAVPPGLRGGAASWGAGAVRLDRNTPTR